MCRAVCFFILFVSVGSRTKAENTSDIVAPLVSFFLPGFDQWWEGDYLYSSIYTGGAVFGLAFADYHSARIPLDEENSINSKDPHVRRTLFGLQSVSLFGGLSAYHSFQEAVKSRKGDYEFIDNHDGMEVVLAPFNFSYLLRPTTLIPLGLAAWLYSNSTSRETLAKYRLKMVPLTTEDKFFIFGTSYNAGVWEEAVFRGWLMPVFKEYVGILDNLFISTLFAYAHVSTDNPLPLLQFLFGYYVGEITKKNGWSISEAIFIHTWWDVIALTAVYSLERDGDVVIWLPRLRLTF